MNIDFVIHTDLEALINELGICGCGNPELAYKAVHEMLKRSSSKEESTITCAMDNDDTAIPYIYFMAYVLDSLGFLEHGSSIRCSWLTEKGENLLKALEVLEKYDYDFEDALNTAPNEFYIVEEKQSNAEN